MVRLSVGGIVEFGDGIFFFFIDCPTEIDALSLISTESKSNWFAWLEFLCDESILMMAYLLMGK